MFNLKEKVQNKMNSKYWSRWASIYSSEKIWSIFINQDSQSIVFWADVESSDLYEEYDTSITINKKTWNIKYSCDCLAYWANMWCKHIWGLARQIEKDYNITNSLEIINKNNWLIENENENENEKDFSDMSEKEIYQELLVNDDLLRSMMTMNWVATEWMSSKIFNHLKEQFLEQSRKSLNIEDKYNKLAIFEELEINNKFIEEEDLFKIKLDFCEWNSYYQTDPNIKMEVYKCKILKNGKLSAGTIVKRESLSYRWIPKRIGKLKFFVDEKWDYYNRSSIWITFLDSPEYFMENLFLLDEVFDKKNNKIKVCKSIYNPKISVKKNTSWKYEIKLVLEWTEKWDIFFKNFKIIWEEWLEYFACFRIKNKELFFFKSDLSYNFIKTINSWDLILTEEEFDELKKWKNFESIIKHSYKIKDLWIDKKIWEAKWKLIVEIDEEFENVKVKVWINYGNNDIFWYDFNKVDFFIENKDLILDRDKAKEKSILKDLSALEDLANNTSNFEFVKIVDENIDNFFDEIEKLIEKDFIIEYSQKTKRISNNVLWVKVDIKSWIDFFDINTSLTIWEKEIEQSAELLNLILKSKKQKTITLDNWMTLLLKNDLSKWLDLLNEIWIEEDEIWTNKQISKHNIWLLKETKLSYHWITFSLDKEVSKLKQSLSNFSWIWKRKVPNNVKANLRDYQQAGYNWLNFLEKYNFSWFLADDMWLWKTLQTLSLLQKVYNTKNITTKSLVVCPTSLVFNWIDEIKKFTPDLKVEYIKDWKTAFSDIKKDTQVVIVSYWIISNLSEKDEIKEKFHYLILDEAQNIKNPITKRTKNICKIASKYRLALSGTPIENNLMELWSGFNFLMPWFLGNLNSFKSKYMWTNPDKDSLKTLSAKVKPFILRRKKEDVLKELPEKVEEVIKLEMWVKQKEFYTKLKNAFKLQITKELEENWLNKSRFKVLDSLLKLRQACLSPKLIPWDWTITSESVKLDYIKDSIDEMLNNWHNLLIFSQFTGFLKYIREILENKNIEYNYLDWQTKAKDRKWLVDEFNNGNKQVFIISLKAGGTGLNLTKADYVIHLDPWWNPAVENQATDRAHRMGQKKTVFVQKLICKDSIEEKILKLQEKKKKLIDDVFSGNFSGSLSKDDIDFIFE